MSKAESTALKAIPVILLIATGLAFAGGSNGLPLGAISLYALCVIIAFAIQCLAYIPSVMGLGEKHYDLTGSITYLTVMVVAVALSGEPDLRAILLTGAIAVWALRLGSYLFMRIMKDGKDGRFDQIKKSPLRLLMTWLLQGLWVVFSLAAALAAVTSVNQVPFGLIGAIGFIVWAVGFGIEALSDRQKNQFRRDPANKGKFIQTGLWAWSRHPNYFGEIMLWAGVAIMALPALQGWQYVTLISPIFVYLLLTRISGVPLLEARSDERWGGQADYEAYKARTPELMMKPPSS